MKAVSVIPGKPDSAQVAEVPEPPESDGPVLVRTHAMGVCGTDMEIVTKGYGEPPPGEERLVLGHESLGEVLEAPDGCGLAPGDLVVGIVRRPDPAPCEACAQGRWDFCRNGGYTERGIKQRHGYASERYRISPEFAVKVPAQLGDLGVLLEPTSVVAKAWDLADSVCSRRPVSPHVVLVTGAGPIGLLAALLARQRGLEVHVVDRVTDGPKPQLVADIGATYHSAPVTEIGVCADVVIECTGVGQLVFDCLTTTAPDAVIVLTGISSGAHTVNADLDAVNKELVLGNEVLLGSVNAARQHYEIAAEALAAADAGWLGRLVSRQVPLADWPSALQRQPDDVKVVIDLTAG